MPQEARRSGSRPACPSVIQDSVRLAASGSRLRCDFSLAEDLWLAEVDAGQIGQVIRNLVLNAREAKPEGGVISVRAENVVLGPQENPSLPPGDYVRVSITDWGGGISKEVLPKIFDPYFSTKQRGTQKGMGLGLSHLPYGHSEAWRSDCRGVRAGGGDHLPSPPSRIPEVAPEGESIRAGRAVPRPEESW